MEDALEKLKTYILAKARTIVISGGEIPPTLFLVDKDGDLSVIVIDGGGFNPEDAGRFLADALRLSSIQAVALVHEAWMVRLAGGKTPDVKPSEHPGRVDALVVMTASRDEAALTTVAFERDGEGRRLLPVEKASTHSTMDPGVELAGRIPEQINAARNVPSPKVGDPIFL